jgi:hypothetical protein
MLSWARDVESDHGSVGSMIDGLVIASGAEALKTANDSMFADKTRGRDNTITDAIVPEAGRKEAPASPNRVS